MACRLFDTELISNGLKLVAVEERRATFYGLPSRLELRQGRVSRKKGSDAAVDITDIKNGEGVSICITQVAAVS